MSPTSDLFADYRPTNAYFCALIVNDEAYTAVWIGDHESVEYTHTNVLPKLAEKYPATSIVFGGILSRQEQPLVFLWEDGIPYVHLDLPGDTPPLEDTQVVLWARTSNSSQGTPVPHVFDLRNSKVLPDLATLKSSLENTL